MKKYLDSAGLAYLWDKVKKALSDKVSTINNRAPDVNGNVALTSVDLNAYPLDGMQHIAFSINTGEWVGSGPFSFSIYDMRITATSICNFIFINKASAIQDDVVWTTNEGVVTLTTDTKPVSTVSGTLIITQTNPDTTDVLAYPLSGIRQFDFTLPLSAWSGTSPYQAVIQNSTATKNTYCDFSISSGMDKLITDITWKTTSGSIIFVCDEKPTGLISGTMMLTEILSNNEITTR